ncbi:MAG TPA: LysR substrate-binding domain-containing protein [Methylomirabilota bacterium]|jgi:DNA-binding transcriptional LysR family regulator|nr:LysR substrate-binding domain-containing protein [Methylomirabilota bacterium]
MNPTIRQLETFLAVARSGSFRRAAESVHLSQPALSQHVGELERGLGARLFDRRGRKVELTEAGRILEDHALRMFAMLAGAREAIAELSGVVRGSLVVGASTTPGIYLLPAIISAFERQYPGISVHLRIANSRVIEDQVRANELDLGVVGGHGLRPGEECLAAGVLDELVLIVPPGHRWAGQRRLSPSRLSQERLLTREEGSATRQVMERALQQAGVKIGRTMELGHTEAIKQAVMAGLGVAFVSVYAVRGELATGRLQPARLQGLDIKRHFHVIHNESRALTARGQAFITAVHAQGTRSTNVRTRRAD